MLLWLHEVGCDRGPHCSHPLDRNSTVCLGQTASPRDSIHCFAGRYRMAGIQAALSVDDRVSLTGISFKTPILHVSFSSEVSALRPENHRWSKPSRSLGASSESPTAIGAEEASRQEHGLTEHVRGLRCTASDASIGSAQYIYTAALPVSSLQYASHFDLRNHWKYSRTARGTFLCGEVPYSRGMLACSAPFRQQEARRDFALVQTFSQ